MRLGGKMRGPWPVIETPTLIIWGEEDAALGVELLDGTDDYVRDLTIRRLPGVSHWVQQEAPQKVNPILYEWLPGAGA
jgi:pimeloyl-ACP methyl ester carboxylesterase